MPRNRNNQPLIYLPWQKQNLTSSSATLTILIAASLYKGLLSQNSDYNLTAPASVSVQQGLCAHIPCSFTYNDEDRIPREKLHGFWLLEKEDYVHFFATKYSYYAIPGILVATNDDRGTLMESVDKRFQLTGDLEAGNCSFSILKAQSEDTGKYYFRIESGMMRFSYNANPVQQWKIEVLVTEKPQLQKSSALLPGQEVVLNCSTLGPCTGDQPEISWTTDLTEYSISQWTRLHSNGSRTYGSDFIFTPSLSDRGKFLTCRVRYPATWEPAENTLLLDFLDERDSAVANASRLRLSGRMWESPVTFFLVIVSLIKVSFCFLFIFSVLGFLNAKKTPQEGSSN